MKTAIGSTNVSRKMSTSVPKLLPAGAAVTCTPALFSWVTSSWLTTGMTTV